MSDDSKTTEEKLAAALEKNARLEADLKKLLDSINEFKQSATATLNKQQEIIQEYEQIVMELNAQIAQLLKEGDSFLQLWSLDER